MHPTCTTSSHRVCAKAGHSCAWTAPLIGCTRSVAPSQAGHDLWFSGKHKRHGGNIQVLTGPTGYPEWVSDVEPGSVHAITAARHHALPAMYPAARDGLPTLTDKGYTGAGIGIIVPTKGHKLASDNQTRNAMISALRAPAERANALLKRTWKALERVTLDPWRIGAITAAALVLLHLRNYSPASGSVIGVVA